MTDIEIALLLCAAQGVFIVENKLIRTKPIEDLSTIDGVRLVVNLALNIVCGIAVITRLFSL